MNFIFGSGRGFKRRKVPALINTSFWTTSVDLDEGDENLELYTLLISQGAILNFQWMTSFAERSYTWPKWLPKMKALLTLILQCVRTKRNVFTLYQEEYFLYTMSLWVCYRNFKAVVQRYSWIDDIEDKRELI